MSNNMQLKGGRRQNLDNFCHFVKTAGILVCGKSVARAREITSDRKVFDVAPNQCPVCRLLLDEKGHS